MPLVRRIAGWAPWRIAAGILVLFAMPSYRQGEASIAGKTALDFPLTLAGKSEHLSDLKGKVVVLNFWATWCPPCVEETPSLNRLEKYIDFARWNGSRHQRRRRWRRVRKIPARIKT